MLARLSKRIVFGYLENRKVLTKGRLRFQRERSVQGWPCSFVRAAGRTGRACGTGGQGLRDRWAEAALCRGPRCPGPALSHPGYLSDTCGLGAAQELACLEPQMPVLLLG